MILYCVDDPDDEMVINGNHRSLAEDYRDESE